MPFLVQAFDGDDAESMTRRMAAREAHLATARKLKAEGALLFAGAMLDEAGKMTGSTLVFEAPDQAAVEAIIRADPYLAGDVWRRWTITPFRVAPL
jgi:uncharacterized protein